MAHELSTQIALLDNAASVLAMSVRDRGSESEAAQLQSLERVTSLSEQTLILIQLAAISLRTIKY